MKGFRLISSFVLICLVLFAGSNFMVGMHACGGHIQKVSLFTKAEGCGMEKAVACHRVMPESCCEDETIVHDAQDFKSDLGKIHVADLSGANAVLHHPLVLASIIPSGVLLPSHDYPYDPPLRSVAITISIQVFLI